MKYLDEHFLLDTPQAQSLYEGYVKGLPIIDYHCHLSPREIAENKPFNTITQLWLGGDHYKWRAMRANGIDERYITGDANDWEKFEAWAATVPYTMRNPLYDWTHLELRTAFGIYDLLSPKTAKDIYERCNAQLPQLRPRDLMRHYGVETVCTTDDPADDLQWHKAIANDGFEVKALPTWRPDKVLAFEDTTIYREYLDKLGKSAGIEITDLDSLLSALRSRHDYFAACGCRVADHGLSRVPYAQCDYPTAKHLFDRLMHGESLFIENRDKLQTYLLLELCRMNHAAGWAQQWHFGPLRNVNTRMLRQLGPDTGFDTIGDWKCAEALAQLLNALDETDQLAPTILYNINPADNYVVAAMIANFQGSGIPGKIQFGSGWWFNDQLLGMKAQIDALSTQGLLSRFVGMLTDSRSFLSYPRHDYFRRLLCQLLGRDIAEGRLPETEFEFIGQMAANISYHNAKRYFKF